MATIQQDNVGNHLSRDYTVSEKKMNANLAIVQEWLQNEVSYLNEMTNH